MEVSGGFHGHRRRVTCTVLHTLFLYCFTRCFYNVDRILLIHVLLLWLALLFLSILCGRAPWECIATCAGCTTVCAYPLFPAEELWNSCPDFPRKHWDKHSQSLCCGCTTKFRNKNLHHGYDSNFVATCISWECQTGYTNTSVFIVCTATMSALVLCQEAATFSFGCRSHHGYFW